jgi:hypothetical protein
MIDEQYGGVIFVEATIFKWRGQANSSVPVVEDDIVRYPAATKQVWAFL